MSYLLNSNIVGMNFNDKTCLITNPSYTKVKYMTRIGDDGAEVKNIDNEDLPSKKVKLLNHFSKELRVKRDMGESKMTYDQRIKS